MSASIFLHYKLMLRRFRLHGEYKQKADAEYGARFFSKPLIIEP